MADYFFVVGDYLNGKPVYPVIRRILNLLFSISLTSFLFKKFYFNYIWLDFSDYKSILDFFINGKFFIPFSLFIIIHILLDSIAEIVFFLFTFRKSIEIVNEVYNYQFNKSDYRNIMGKMNDNGVLKMPITFDKSFFIETYKYLATNIPIEEWKEQERSLEEQKSSTKDTFKLTLKGLITITIYFITISYFGLLLYMVVAGILILTLFGLYFGYLLMDIIPSAIKKFHFEVGRYLEEKAEV